MSVPLKATVVDRKIHWMWSGLVCALVAAGILVRGEPFLAATADDEVKRLAPLLQLAPGKSVADVGAGAGRVAVALARLVGPRGRVYATEINAARLADIRNAAAKAALRNVIVIEGVERSTGLPSACCDAILLRAVYHHFTDPVAINASLFEALRSNGRLAVIDFEPRALLRLWASGNPNKRGGHGVSLAMAAEEITGAGFQVEQTIEKWNGNLYCVVFRRPASRSQPPATSAR